MDLDWQQFYAFILPYIPAGIAGDLTLIGTFLIALAAVIVRFWKQPAAGSKWLILYRLISSIALKRKGKSGTDEHKP